MSLNIDAKSVLVGGVGAYAAMTLLGGDSKKSSGSLSGLNGTKRKRSSSPAKKSAPKKAGSAKRKTKRK